MKTTKNIFAIIAITALIITPFEGCRKGDGDPLISIHSRKARVVGEWTISKWEQESNYTGTGTNYNSTGNESTEIDDDRVTMKETWTYTYTSGTSNSTINNTWDQSGDVDESTVTFTKDGTFIITRNYKNIKGTKTEVDTYNGTTTTTTYTTTSNPTEEMSGTWNFLGGVESDYKKNERIVLNIQKIKITSTLTKVSSSGGTTTTETETESDSQTFANGEQGTQQIWHLSTLKNKEMIIDGEINSSYSTNSTTSSGTTSSTYSGSSSGKGSIKGTLIQK